LAFSIFGFRQKNSSKNREVATKIFFFKNIYLILAKIHLKNEIIA
jgi:hypothetical protein